MNKITLITVTFFSLLGWSHFAYSASKYKNNYRYDNQRNHGRNNYDIKCGYSDKGYEEHWGGHNSCHECLQKHGKCIERCYEEETTCTAEGIRNGYTQQFSVTDKNSWRTEERAVRQCELSGYDDCRLIKCESDDRLVSRQRC